MITKEEFVKFIEEYQTYDKAFERIETAIIGKPYISNMYESDWNLAVGKMLDIFLKSHFTEEGCDWINYWLFEDVDNKTAYFKEDLFDNERKYPLDTINDLWNFLNSDKKLYFKNV